MPLRLFKRGEIWWIRGTVAGHSVYESTRLGDRRAAEAKRIRREAELVERDAFGAAATLTFAAAAADYLEAGGEARFLGPIIEYFGARKRLAEIDNPAITACAKALYPLAGPATINRQVIGPIAAVSHRAATDNPSLYRRFPRRREPKGRIRWLKPEEAALLIRAADARVRRIIIFLLGTGCRVSEALTLDVAHLYLATNEAWILQSKNGDARMVPFPLMVRFSLMSAELPAEGKLFLTPKGEPYVFDGSGRGGHIQTAFNAARDAAGLGPDVTPHVLRHTWATWYYAATKDFGGLMDNGGWRKADMANRYRKLAPADLPARLLRHGWDLGAKSGQAAPLDGEIINDIKSVG